MEISVYQKTFISIRALEITTEIELSKITGLFLMHIIFVEPAASLPKHVLLILKHDNDMINDYVLNSNLSQDNTCTLLHHMLLLSNIIPYSTTC